MPFGASRIEYEHAYRSNIALAADLCVDAGIAVLLEPINQIDIPGYFLRDTRQAIAVIEDLSRPNLMLQYDIYHAQMTEGHITRTLREHLPVIGHIQIASPPDRTEPGTGEVDYDFLFEYLHSAGYEGWIGCEYRPSHGTVDSLAWARTYGIG
jgi:hydroxypyruvate isomerase